MAPAARADRLPVLATACFPGRAAEVSSAREFARGVLGPGCPHLDDVLVMVSEIASNAICHTASARDGGWFDLTVSVSGSTVRVAIADRGGPTVPCLPPGDDGCEAALSGRGLRIVDALADRWGHAGDELGRVVWFEISTRNAGSSG